MDIAALSISMKQASLYQQVGIALTKKVMDTNEGNLQALMKIMELSVNPNLGKNIDISV
ncbi:MAG: YjfB family protein [Lutisporaceae bacterium]